MLLRAAFCALVLLALTAATAQGIHRRQDRCNLAGARTVALTPETRVFQSTDDGYYYGCRRRTGTRALLWEQDDLYVDGTVRAAAGHFVAHSVSIIPACKADCPPGVRSTHTTAVTDVRTGRTRELHDGPVPRLLLRRSGTVVWTAEPRPAAQLSVWGSGGVATLLDSGDIHTVRAANGTMTWSNSGGDRSATMP